jgi:hypothetical protein
LKKVKILKTQKERRKNKKKLKIKEFFLEKKFLKKR